MPSPNSKRYETIDPSESLDPDASATTPSGALPVAGLIVSVIARVVVASILTDRWVPMSPLGFFYILPQDVLHLIFVIFVLALAHIFKAAAEMADDQAQIV